MTCTIHTSVGRSLASTTPCPFSVSPRLLDCLHLIRQLTARTPPNPTPLLLPLAPHHPGPSIGPILGGALSESPAGWRATFYFLIGFGASCLALMVWLPETFRQERSMAWRLARDKALAHARHEDGKRSRPPSVVDKGLVVRGSQPMGKVLTASGEEVKVKVGLRDVNPLSATGVVLRQPQNVLAVLFSGCLFVSLLSSSPQGRQLILFISRQRRPFNTRSHSPQQGASRGSPGTLGRSSPGASCCRSV